MDGAVVCNYLYCRSLRFSVHSVDTRYIPYGYVRKMLLRKLSPGLAFTVSVICHPSYEKLNPYLVSDRIRENPIFTDPNLDLRLRICIEFA